MELVDGSRTWCGSAENHVQQRERNQWCFGAIV